MFRRCSGDVREVSGVCSGVCSGDVREESGDVQEISEMRYLYHLPSFPRPPQPSRSVRGDAGDISREMLVDAGKASGGDGMRPEACSGGRREMLRDVRR